MQANLIVVLYSLTLKFIHPSKERRQRIRHGKDTSCAIQMCASARWKFLRTSICAARGYFGVNETLIMRVDWLAFNGYLSVSVIPVIRNPAIVCGLVRASSLKKSF